MDIWIVGLVAFLTLGSGAYFLIQRRINLPSSQAQLKISKLATNPPLDTISSAKSDSSDDKIVPKASPKEETPRTLNEALGSTRANLWGRIQGLFKGDSHNHAMEGLEEVLYTSDLGPQTVQRLMKSIDGRATSTEKKDPEFVRLALKQEMLNIFSGVANSTEIETKFTNKELFSSFQFHQPTVWLILGVNGAGKTTSIGKLAAALAAEGKKVLVAAGDTFRAAAGAQLKTWTDRAQVEIFSPVGVTDPSAVAFDAVSMGKSRGYDVIIIDTAGRLHTQGNLMEELKKMKRVIQKVMPEAPHETLLVLDANQGQNALLQAKEFHKALEMTGVILTKLDGSAKGGVAVGVACELNLPVKLIGVGEKLGDLRAFHPQAFVDSILSR